MSAPCPDFTMPFTGSAVLEIASNVLERDWALAPAAIEQALGVIWSHRGHYIVVDGIRNGYIYATAMLPDGTRRQVHSAPMPVKTPAEGYGRALAYLVVRDLEPAHNAVCSAQVVAREVRAAAPADAQTSWDRGQAVTSWGLKRGRAVHRVFNDRSNPGRVVSEVRFGDLAVEDGIAILSAMDTRNINPRRHLEVHGAVAERLKEAVPDLYGQSTSSSTRLIGRLTLSLFVDDLVSVRLTTYACDFPIVSITVTGSLDNQLRAIAAR
ncbi:hypothetical protein [Streptomyces noursei]|uniref:hypothetical protein n=1 Tax=Streptomyces noursei TaxID=1971 RepID=UPI0023B79D2E|nr:hypothetical protein [Streptomyces noursei]